MTDGQVALIGAIGTLAGGALVAIINWLRGRHKDGADAAHVITQAASTAVTMAREESEQLRAELHAARAEIAAMRAEMANLTREVHELRGTVSGLEREREQLLDALARWQPPTGGAGE